MRRVIDISPEDTVRRIRKVGRYHLALFVLPALSLLFYGWLRAPHLNERPDNPQRVAPLRLRGSILDRADRPLAIVQGTERIYPQGESVGPLVGYHLRGRNQSGLEAALQERLSPPLPPNSLTSALRQDRDAKEGKPRLRGPDVKLTLDASLQEQIFDSLKGVVGAVVVADRQGRILAAVSSPSFDSNRVREEWQELRNDPGDPFIERVGSGLYPVTAPAGQGLFEPADLAQHDWFLDNPYPGYPVSSAALMLDDRLLLTPLMLLEMSYWLSGIHPSPGLHLLSDHQPSKGHTPLELAVPLSLGGQDSWVLGGPPFRDSPEFEVVIGTVEEKLFYALVVENKETDTDRIRRQIEALKKVVGAGEL